MRCGEPDGETGGSRVYDFVQQSIVLMHAIVIENDESHLAALMQAELGICATALELVRTRTNDSIPISPCLRPDAACYAAADDTRLMSCLGFIVHTADCFVGGWYVRYVKATGCQ